MSTSRTTARVMLGVVILLLAVVAGACNPNPAAPPAKDANTAKPMNTPAEAEAVFDAAEQELGDMLLSSAGYGHGPPVIPQPAPPAPQQDGLQVSEAVRKSEDRCARACRALASMQRAADRLCELTGEEDGRCKSVRARVASAREVVRATCPDCEA